VACAENVRDVPGAAAEGFACAATDGDGLTSTDFDAAAEAEAESVAVHVTVIAPADWYTWFTAGPLPVFPSPKVQSYEYGAAPPVAEHVNETDWPTSAACRGALTLAPSGAGGAVTLTVCVWVTLVPPRESVAVTAGE